MDELKEQLQKESEEYLQQSKYFTEQLVALQTQMDDLRLPDNDNEDDDEEEREEELDEISDEVRLAERGPLLREHLQASLVRQSSHKQSLREKVSDHCPSLHTLPL